MKSLLHVFYTWLVAVPLFPLLFVACNFWVNGEAALYLLLPVALFGILFSLPVLLCCWLLFMPLIEVRASLTAKFCLWMLAVALCITGTTGFICIIIFGSFTEPQLVQAVGAAVLAAMLSISLRLRQFRSCANSQTTHEHELL
jgi:hypothetical protein